MLITCMMFLHDCFRLHNRSAWLSWCRLDSLPVLRTTCAGIYYFTYERAAHAAHRAGNTMPRLHCAGVFCAASCHLRSWEE